ncbi:hypothetical protein [Candidatus Aciduliprofundum boonei]|uniref:Uncharacterized protein n=1 Tax=Aciduliprofundum boonei (strain DSM 19572 / T469) TaxID=439481 RepID=B5IGZ8_ACIB4|nr:hypothetical protein [Candidatus Aciduliprofundum boonei]ADD08723.1 conserved hypothetical protein [Aciduliprofundum boonei T469]EDY34466.1 hypothetical protein ABOONEI_1440 [Aciduliprofundum boonei T469]HII54906.1 hypothetical protein [Candidatus Aciduliprofundum boonei]
MYVVFKFKGEDAKMREMYQDDLVGRQTIIKRDAKSLGLDGKEVYIVVEGSSDAIERAKEIAEDFIIKGEEAGKIYRKIKESEEEASFGMGAIFG